MFRNSDKTAYLGSEGSSSLHPDVQEQSIKVVLVEDEGLFLDLLQSAVSQQPGLEVAGAFQSATAALDQIPDLQPDVVLLDIFLQDSLNGIELGLRLRDVLPSLGIVLLSNHNRPSILQSVPEEALEGWSYLVKDEVSDLDMLRRAIEGTAKGLVVFNPGAMNYRATGALGKLTERERSVLALMARGYSNAKIAENLSIASKTVENYINRVYQKLAVDWEEDAVQPRVKAVLTYLKQASFQDE